MHVSIYIGCNYCICAFTRASHAYRFGFDVAKRSSTHARNARERKTPHLAAMRVVVVISFGTDRNAGSVILYRCANPTAFVCIFMCL